MAESRAKVAAGKEVGGIARMFACDVVEVWESTTVTFRHVTE